MWLINWIKNALTLEIFSIDDVAKTEFINEGILKNWTFQKLGTVPNSLYNCELLWDSCTLLGTGLAISLDKMIFAFLIY